MRFPGRSAHGIEWKLRSMLASSSFIFGTMEGFG